MDLDYTPSELMATAGARELQDRQVVAVGLGLPVVASFLAKLTHAPNMTILFELGVIDPEPIHCGVGLADPRVWYRAKVLSSFVDILGAILHKGLVDVGFLGGLEMDQYGNLNTTLLGDPRGQVPPLCRQRGRERHRLLRAEEPSSSCATKRANSKRPFRSSPALAISRAAIAGRRPGCEADPAA